LAGSSSRMAREGSEAASPVRRTAAQRKGGRLWAKLSGDNAVRSMAAQVATLQQKLNEYEAHIGMIYNDPEVSDRVQAIVPALRTLLQGRTPTMAQRLRRNVALHADAAGMSVQAAAVSQLRKAQHGPRLEHRGMLLSPLAKEFVPGVSWIEEPVVTTDKGIDDIQNNSGGATALLTPAVHASAETFRSLAASLQDPAFQGEMAAFLQQADATAATRSVPVCTEENSAETTTKAAHTVPTAAAGEWHGKAQKAPIMQPRPRWENAIPERTGGCSDGSDDSDEKEEKEERRRQQVQEARRTKLQLLHDLEYRKAQKQTKPTERLPLPKQEDRKPDLLLQAAATAASATKLAGDPAKEIKRIF